MTKNGRPSRINDIRYFFGNVHTYLQGHEDAKAFGRRLAWFLNGEGFSLGAYPALYIFLTPSLDPGVVQVTDYGGDWWQRYTHIGVSSDFQTALDASELVKRGTVSALQKIRPDLSDAILAAEQTVRAHADDLRFLLKTRETKKYVIDISFNIAVWPAPSSMFVSLTDRVTGEVLEAPPIPLQFYAEAFDLAGTVKITELATTVAPNQSVGAKLTSSRQGGPLVKAMPEFMPQDHPRKVSKTVRRRG